MTSPSSAPRAPHDELEAATLRALAGAARPGPGAPERLHRLFDAMAASRALDVEARRMRERGEGFYTIGSAGHESNAYVADAVRATDPALLHYRSGALFVLRALQAGRSLDDAIRAVLLGLAAAVADPASGGRHKVFGDASLAVIPQTSTIASHLPRAVGVAFALGRARRLGVETQWPGDSLVLCSFGDASLNHSTAVGALNTAAYCSAEGLPLPLLFVCEDNGLGISVPTPPGWVRQAAQRPGIAYFSADGDDPHAAMTAAAEAADHARSTRRPALLHLRTVRFLGHAGTDVEAAYRRPDDLAADLARDPLVALGRLLPDVDLADRYRTIASRVAELAREAACERRLTTADDVMAPLRASQDVPPGPRADDATRARVFDRRLPEDAGPLTLAQSINAALTDELASRAAMCVFGEDVGRKGGVYGLTRGLQQRFGAARVFDTLLDEQSILGLGLGFGVSGLLPVPEIQYLAYLHNAEDQLRGEAASLRFFSAGAYSNPMVVRIAGLGYQKGFGGHFHNDDAVAVLRDIPGLVVAVPARPDDAAGMLRACLDAASGDGRVSVYLEPIALYHERDLYAPGDREWLAPYSPDPVPIGTARTYGDGADLTIVTFGNGLRLSLRAARRLADEGVAARVVDLRWLAPLPVSDVLREARATGRVLVADETRRSGGVSEGVLAALVDAGFDGAMARVASADSYIPLGEAATLVLLSEDDVVDAARSIVTRRSSPLRVRD